SEIKRIHQVNELLRQVPADARARQSGGKLHGKEEILLHYIPPHADMAGFGVASKSNTALPFLQHLKELGRNVAKKWLAGETDGGGAAHLGVSSDANLEQLFIEPHQADAPPLPDAVQGVRTEPGD
ncbi:MAG: hypothetical protein ACM34A_19420, partial [Bacillota bacterium]